MNQPFNHFRKQHFYRLLTAFLALTCWMALTPVLFGQLTITSNTTQNGGVLNIPNAPNTLNISNVGNPLLTMTNGASTTQVNRVNIGTQAGNSGSLLLEQSSLLDIQGGAGITGTIGIGQAFGAAGQVRVRTNALLRAEVNGASVGVDGIGELIIEQGGRMEGRFLGVGDGAGSQGTVLVTGANSRIDLVAWNNFESLFRVGGAGLGTMIVSNGGQVTTTGDGELGSTGQGILSLFDAGSAITVGETFYVGRGQSGQGTATIAGGATLTSHGGVIGAVNSSNGPGTTGSVTLTGVGTTWINNGELRIGTAFGGFNEPPDFPSSGSLTVTNNASVVNSDKLLVGHLNSGTMTISGGGTVSAIGNDVNFPVAVDLAMGKFASATATVTGANSALNANGHLRVGVQGNASLTISNGGVVNNHDGMIAFSQETQSSQSSVLVTGAGSQWNNSGNLYVGGNFSHVDSTQFGGQASLTVRDGGLVRSQGDTGIFIFQQSILTGNGGIVMGNTIENRGVVSPGDSAGTMTIAGNFFQNDTGTLLIELGGLTQGTEYDHLIVTNQAFLGGTLAVSLIDGFQLGHNQVFDILTSGNVLSGQFMGLDDNALVGNFNGIDLFIRYAEVPGPAGNGGLVRLYTAIPEPSSMLFVSSLGLFILLRRRKLG